MAVQQIVPIFFTLQGDGSATTFTFALKNMYQAGFGGSVSAGGGFTVVPTSIAATNPPVPVTSATVDANGNITITFTSALPASNFTFEIDLIFASGGATSSSATQSQNVTLVGTSTVVVSGTIASNITQVNGATISATNTLFDQITDGTNAMGVMTNFGTTPGAVKALNINSSIFSGTTSISNTGGSLNANITNTVPVTLTSTTVTNTVSENLLQLNSVALGSPSNYGTSPGAVSVMGVNAFITNTVPVTLTSTTITGTVAVTQSTSPWVVSLTSTTVTNTVAENLTQVAGTSLGATAVTNFGTAPAAAAVMGVNASLFSGTTGITNTGGAINANITNTVPVTLTSTTITGTVAVTQSTSPWVTQDKATQAIASGVGTASGFAIGNAGTYNTTQPAPTNGQAVELQLDQSGNLLTFGGVQSKTGAAWTTATTINTLQFPTGTTTTGAPVGASAMLIQLNQTTTLTGGAVTFQGTYDGTNWATIPTAQLLNPNTFATLTNPYTFVPSTNQPFLVLLQGYQNVRLNLTTTITGTGSVTPFWAVLPYSISTPSSSSSTVNLTQVASVTLGATAVTAYGSAPAAANVMGVNAFVTNTVTENLTQVASTNLGTPQTFGTAPTGVVIGTSSDIYVGGTRARTNQATTAAGVVDVNIVGSLGATNSATNGSFFRITDNTTAITAAVSAYGSAPTGTAVMGVNAFVTNTVTVSGTVSITANSSVNVNQIGGSAVVSAATGVQKVGIVGNTGATLDGASGATAPANSLSVSGTFNTALPTLTNGQAGTLQLDAKGQQFIDLNYYVGSPLGAGANYGTSPGAVNVMGVNAFVTNTVAENITQIAGSAVVTSATGVQKVGVVGNAGAIFDAVIGAGTAAANMVHTGGVYTSTALTLTSGQSGALQSDTAGNQYVNTEGRKASYRVGVIGGTPISSATNKPTWSVTGSATKTVRITRIRLTATAATGTAADISLQRYSALSGGTSASQAANVAKLDTNDGAQTAVVNTWSAAATTGTQAGIFSTERYEIITASVSVNPGYIEWDFSDKNARALVLRGTSDFIGVVITAVGTTPVYDVWVEWTEE